MKGTAHGPQKPVPGATASSEAAGEQIIEPAHRANRMTAALLTERPAGASQGYDPYNTVVSRSPDEWKRKR